MKACPKCQRINAGDTWLCLCGYEFDGTESALPAPAAGTSRARRRFSPGRFLAKFALGSLGVFFFQNLFLFGAYWVRLGASIESALRLLGTPYAVAYPQHRATQGERWRDYAISERDSTWTYKFTFLHFPIGGYNVQFTDGKVSYTILGINHSSWRWEQGSQRLIDARVSQCVISSDVEFSRQ